MYYIYIYISELEYMHARIVCKIVNIYVHFINVLYICELELITSLEISLTAVFIIFNRILGNSAKWQKCHSYIVPQLHSAIVT